MASAFNSSVTEVCSRFGSDFKLKPKQKEALEHIWTWDPLHKKDLVVNLPTGYGKSVIFQVLPELLSKKHHMALDHCLVLVICPLNVIQADQVARLKALDITCCRLDVACNAHTLGAQDAETPIDLEEVISGRFNVIYAHPEALFKSANGEKLLQSEDFRSRVGSVFIDECHKVQEWGHDFRTAFSQLDSLVAFFPSVPLVAMSGTLTKDQLREIPRLLCQRGSVTVISENPDRTNIYLAKALRKSNVDVTTAYEDIFIPECHRLYEEGMNYPVTLLYMPMQHSASALSYIQKLFGHVNVSINDESVMYAAVYSRLDKETMRVVTSELKKPQSEPSRIRLVFCTSAIGMGFDSPQITNVIHAKPPYLISDYFQEIGRAGRSGQSAVAKLWYNAADLGQKGVSEDIKLYCRSTDVCLRNILLAVFGFTKEVPNTERCCDICLSKNVTDK